MKKLLWLLLLLAFCLTACSALPKQTDAADEAILRMVAMYEEDGRLKLVGMTAATETEGTKEPPEKVEGTGEDYLSARDDAEREREVSFTHATDWIVERDVLDRALDAFVADPDLTYDAHIYIVEDAKDFLDQLEDPVKALDDLSRGLGENSATVLEISRTLCAGEGYAVPLVEAKEEDADVKGTVTVWQWNRQR